MNEDKPRPRNNDNVRSSKVLPSPSAAAEMLRNSPAGRTRPDVSSIALFAAKVPTTYINSFCGAMAGVASGIVTCPLDVIKTRLQSQGSFRRRARPGVAAPLYNGMIGTAKAIWKEDSFRGMYRGLGPMLLGYLPTWAVYMSVYEKTKVFYYDKVDNRWAARIIASVTAGACSTLVTNPIWVIKTRLMSQVGTNAAAELRTPWQYKSTIDAARNMYREEGIMAFYSGLTPALLGLTHVAIQFPLYEYFKLKFTGLELGANSEQDQEVHLVGVLFATFFSKLCATSATYPHEVLRTRLQTQQIREPSHSDEGISFRGALGSSTRTASSSDGMVTRSRPFGFDKIRDQSLIGASSDGMRNLPRYRGVWRTCRTIYQEEGFRAFYNGMGTNMIRAIPAAITTMMTFEFLKQKCFQLQTEGKQALEDQD